jgi:hypothetical protein
MKSISKKPIVKSRPMKDPMTSNFRKGVLSSHKPPSPHPEALETPSNQKNPVGYHGIPTPHFPPKTYLFMDQISPEQPGIQKQSIVRPPGSLEVTKEKENHYNYEEKSENLLPLEPIIISWEPNFNNTIQKKQEAPEETRKSPRK